MMKKATPEEAVAVTAVFWDINTFPVPPGFDARRVGPCIKRLLEKYGYYGPLTINAVGFLTDVHVDILRALSSSGINLYYNPFGSSHILSLMFKWLYKNPPPTNILGICNRSGFLRPCREFNLFGPFSYSCPHSFPQEDAASWISLILAESEAVETGESASYVCSICKDYLSGQGLILAESEAVETGESASYVCSICEDYPSGQGFESFTRHLSSLEHARSLDYFHEAVAKLEEDGNPPTIVRFQPEKATPEEAVAVTSVFWDMKTFPVPLGFDARRVSRCIKRFLEKYGYFGPLTINAVGILTDVPDGILRGLSSTGINFYHALHGSTDIMSLMSRWISKNPPPANILGICDPRGFSLPLSGYNLFRPFSYSSPQQDAFLWESSLLADSEALEEDTGSETAEYASNDGLICLGFESFTRLFSLV